MADYDNDSLSVEDLLAAFGAPAPQKSAPKKKKKTTSQAKSKPDYPGSLSDGEMDLLVALGLAEAPKSRKNRKQPTSSERESIREASKREQHIRSQQWQEELRRREERAARANAQQDEERIPTAIDQDERPVIEEGGFRRSAFPSALYEGGLEPIKPFDVGEPSFMQERAPRPVEQPAELTYEQAPTPIPAQQAQTAPRSDMPVMQPASVIQPAASMPAVTSVMPGMPGAPAVDQHTQTDHAIPAEHQGVQSFRSEQPVTTHTELPKFVEQKPDAMQQAVEEVGAQAFTEDIEEPDEPRSLADMPAPVGQPLQPFNASFTPGPSGFFERKVVLGTDHVGETAPTSPVAAMPQAEDVSADLSENIKRRTFSFVPVSSTTVIQKLGAETAQPAPSLTGPIETNATIISSESEKLSAASGEIQASETTVEAASTAAQEAPSPGGEGPAPAAPISPTQSPAALSGQFSQPLPMQPSAPMPGVSAPFVSPQPYTPDVSQAMPPAGNAYDPAMSQFLGALGVPAVVVPDTEIETHHTHSKRNTILGIILIVVALLCAVMAIGLLAGLFNTAPSVSSASSSAVQQNPVSQGDTAGATEAVYTYVIRGTDGVAHEATETAVFNQDGFLQESTIEIAVDNADTANALLEQLTNEFGTSVTNSEATDSMVKITLNIPRDDITKEAYTELLSANAAEFKAVS